MVLLSVVLLLSVVVEVVVVVVVVVIAVVVVVVVVVHMVVAVLEVVNSGSSCRITGSNSCMIMGKADKGRLVTNFLYRQLLK